MSCVPWINNRLPVANDPAFEPDNLPPAEVLSPDSGAETDPAVAVWATDFDAWLETPDGLRWLEEQEERLHDSYPYFGYRPF